ncbi:hypothetical protein HK104_006157 [Borealophlyctis nickersoniae]|nr:hypothetical protein HK104_006157 [Borealophlyctis nickersoniae]
MAIFQPDRLEVLLDYLEERRRIEIREEILKQPPPYSEDPIFMAHSFRTSIREDDPVSRVLITEIFEGQNPRTDPYYMFNVTLHRHICKPEYNRKMGYVTNLEDAKTKLMSWIQRREPWRTGRFQACCKALAFHKGMEKNWGASKRLWETLYRGKSELPTQKAIFHILFKDFKHVGNFHAHQCSNDALMYQAANLDPTFVHPGPGAHKGLRYLEGGKETKAKYPVDEAKRRVVELTSILNEKLQKRRDARGGGSPDVLKNRELLDLRALDTEHALCEIQKYVKIKAAGPVKLQAAAGKAAKSVKTSEDATDAIKSEPAADSENESDNSPLIPKSRARFFNRSTKLDPPMTVENGVRKRRSSRSVTVEIPVTHKKLRTNPQ